MAAFAARYARAFADVVLAAHLAPEQIDAQLRSFQNTLAESTELRTALFNPSIPSDQRIGVIDALAPRLGLSREVRNFLAVLLRHERMNAVEEIVTAYRAELDRRRGISEVEVISARTLDSGERHAMSQQVARLAGTEVRTHFHEDGSLLGGAVVRIGSTVYDGSVRGRLNRMKQELMAG